jgi:hypothetical protein
VIDVPSDVHDRTRDFWGSALRARVRRGENYPEYHVFEDSAAAGTVMVQDIGSTPARVHLDIEADDVQAEVARLVGLGATEVERHDHWVVLKDPAGLRFCVVPGEGADFEARAIPVG